MKKLLTKLIRKIFPLTYSLDGLKGLAMATNAPGDLDLLGVDWWYVWGVKATDDERYVPMTRNWSVPDIPADTPYLLVGNEPNAYEPFGHTMSSKYAVERVVAIQEAYPDTFLIVGNVSYDNWWGGLLRKKLGMGTGVQWLKDFLGHYKRITGKKFDQGIGVHSYPDSYKKGKGQLLKYRRVYDGVMWLTESNLAQNEIDLGQFGDFFKLAGQLFDRYACYTNRQDGSGSSLPFPMDLCNDTGLTEIGDVYANL